MRSGKPECAARPLARLTEIAEANGNDWSLGLRAARAVVLAEGAAAERLYREAIERLSRRRHRPADSRRWIATPLEPDADSRRRPVRKRPNVDASRRRAQSCRNT